MIIMKQNCPLCGAIILADFNSRYYYCYCDQDKNHTTFIMNKINGNMYIKLSNFDKLIKIVHH